MNLRGGGFCDSKAWRQWEKVGFSFVTQVRTVMWNCAHRNDSPRMVILRCIGPGNFFLEKVLFPFETCSFECPPDSEVEVWSHGLGGTELVQTRDARDLLIEEDETNDAVPVPLGFAGILLTPEWEKVPGSSAAPAVPPERITAV